MHTPSAVSATWKLTLPRVESVMGSGARRAAAGVSRARIAVHGDSLNVAMEPTVALYEVGATS